jgi:lysophospholipase L1-like esterase
VSTAQLGAPDNAKLIVDCYGDSTTYGYDQGAQVASPMPGSLQTALATASGKPVVVNNLGVNSTTAEDLLHGNAATGQAEFADRIAHSNAAVVVFNFGLNETLRGQSPESFHDALTELVLLAQNAGKKVIISTPNPVDLTLQPWATDLPKMHDVAVSVADETGAALDDEFATLSAQSDWQAELTDGVHPGPALYEAKGESLATVVLEITGLTPTHQLI